MTAHATVRLTPAEDCALARQAPYKSEYRKGEMVAMSSASPRHVRMVTNGGAAAARKTAPWHGFLDRSTRARPSPRALYLS